MIKFKVQFAHGKEVELRHFEKFPWFDRTYSVMFADAKKDIDESLSTFEFEHVDDESDAITKEILRARDEVRALTAEKFFEDRNAGIIVAHDCAWRIVEVGE